MGHLKPGFKSREDFRSWWHSSIAHPLKDLQLGLIGEGLFRVWFIQCLFLKLEISDFDWCGEGRRVWGFEISVILDPHKNKICYTVLGFCVLAHVTDELQTLNDVLWFPILLGISGGNWWVDDVLELGCCNVFSRKVGLCKDSNDEGENVGSGLKSILDMLAHEITHTLSRSCIPELVLAELTNADDVVWSPSSSGNWWVDDVFRVEFC